MSKNTLTQAKQNRRQFLKLLSVGSIGCLGCGSLCGLNETLKHKFQDDSKMTMERVFKFTYNEIIMKVKLLADIMGKDIGRDKFIKYLEEAGKKSGEIDAVAYAKKLGTNSFAAFTTEFRGDDYMVNHILTFKIIADTDKAFETRIIECLWAKTFRENDAADIGHAMFCNRDFTTASAFNPKIRLIRSKTLMQGFDHCNHRWVFEG